MCTTSTPHIDEHQLVDAARAGCLQCFEALVERYHTRIRSYLLRQIGDPEMAADLTQQTFLDAFNRLERFANTYPFAAWLYRIARNNLLHERRRRRLQQSVSLDWMLTEAETEPPAVWSVDGASAYPERDHIRLVLDGLSPAHRNALLHNVAGFSSKEVAGILGISPEAARQRLSRAKEDFRLRYWQLDRGPNAGAEYMPAAALPVEHVAAV